MSLPGCQKMWVKPCNRNAEESFPVLSLKSREQKPPNHLLIQDKDVLQPRPEPHVSPRVALNISLMCIRGSQYGLKQVAIGTCNLFRFWPTDCQHLLRLVVGSR